MINFRESIGAIATIELCPDFREELTHHIADELRDDEYCSRSKIGREGVQCRNRKLTVSNLIVMILGFKSSIQREADRFFKELYKSDFNIREVSKAAFTKARAHLNPEAFKHLNTLTCSKFYRDVAYKRWHNKRLLAADGSRIMLPNHPTIVEEFGIHGFGPHADSTRSLALCSLLYDPLNQLVLDSQIAPFVSSERDLLESHLSKINEGDILLLDRGYPCFWLLFLLTAKKIDYCVRLKDDWWLKVKSFTNSNQNDIIVEFTLPKKDYKKLEEYPQIREQTIKCRLVKVLLDNGETEILCTSLLDTIEYKQEEFKALYHYRWGEEECFKLLKSRMELERFSGKTALAVKQDFHAKVFMLSFMAAFAYPIDEKVKKEFQADEDRKHSQQINRTNALSTIRSVIVDLFLKKNVHKAIEAFDELVFKTREIIRHNRKEKRNHKQKKPYSMNYKPL